MGCPGRKQAGNCKGTSPGSRQTGGLHAEETLPQNQNFGISLEPWKEAIITLKTMIEEMVGVEITTDRISNAIRLLSRERDTKKSVDGSIKNKTLSYHRHGVVECIII